jgi:Icc-related predicted phosphoesterase
MRIQLFSDLHLEFGDFTPPRPAADVLVVAGDLHVGRRGLAWLARHYADMPIVYVLGNHEHYRENVDFLAAKLRAEAPPNLHVLERDQVVLHGTRFLGATLWTDYELHGDANQGMACALASMNDHARIRRGERYQRFAPRDARMTHIATRDWLGARLAEHFDGPTVVVTHHSPSRASVEQLDGEHALLPCYASDLSSLCGEDVQLWLHGHVHQPTDHRIAGTRVLCNPRGYAPDLLVRGFQPDLVIEP